MTPSQKGHLSSSLRSLGLSPSDVVSILEDVSRWSEQCGDEWMINRLKCLRSAYIQFIAGNRYELPWIAHRVYEGNPIPKGVWGKLWTKERTRVPVVLKVLHIYSLFRLPRVTDQQKKKFLTSVWAVPILRFPPELGRLVGEYASRHAFGARPYRRSLISSVRALPPRHRRKFARDFRRGLDYMTAHSVWFPSMFQSWGGLERWMSRDYSLVTKPKGEMTVGNLGITQERGGKLRVFAFPNLLFQVMMNPMKASLFRILRRIPEDCTFNQERGVEWVRTQLQAGRRTWSVDLSDATNHFPLRLQEHVFWNIFRNDEWETHWSLFEMVATGRYGAAALGQKYCKWTKGQPLGAGPSFALFAIGHHAVLHYCKVVNRVTDDCYRILGDDIVISHEAVYRTYRDVLQLLECPVSESKTVSSETVAEFGGQVILPAESLPSTKWLDTCDVGNSTHSWRYFRESPPLRHRGWLNWYRFWYSVYHENHLGIPQDIRSTAQAAAVLYQEAQKEKRESLKERFTFHQLYWQILQDEPAHLAVNGESDQDPRLTTEPPFGVTPVAFTNKPSLLSADSRLYASKDEGDPIRKAFSPGELRVFRKAVSPSLREEDRRRYSLM